MNINRDRMQFMRHTEMTRLFTTVYEAKSNIEVQTRDSEKYCSKYLIKRVKIVARNVMIIRTISNSRLHPADYGINAIEAISNILK